MLKSIYLENWKTHQNTHVLFEKGTNILVGKIGAGKSSIIDAICYSLFGNFPSLQNRKISLAETIMFKPIRRKEAKLKLEFDFDSKSYRVEREIFSEKTNTAKLYQDEKLIAGPRQTDVTDKVSKIIGIDYDLFVKIVYSEQNEIDYFLKIAPSKRKEQFDALFGINNLEKIKINSRQLKSYIDTELDTTQRLIIQLQEQLKNYNLKDTKNSILINQEAITKLKISIEELKLEKEKLKKELDIQGSQKKQFDSFKEELTILNFRFSQVTKDLEVLDAQKTEYFSFSKDFLETEKQNIQKKLKENQELEIKIKTLNSQKAFYFSQLESLQKQIGVIVDFSKILKDKEELLEKINLTIQEKSRLFSQNQETQKSISELEKGFSYCPVCDSQLSPLQVLEKLKIKKELQLRMSLELKELEKNLENFKISLTQLQAQEKKASEQQLLKERIAKIQEEQLILESQEKSLVKPIDSLLLERNAEKISLALDYNNKQKTKSEILESKNQLLEKLKTLTYDENIYLSLLTNYKAQEEREKSNASQILSIQERLKDLEKIVLQYDDLFNKLKDKENSKEKLETKQKDLNYFGLALENSQEHLRKVLVDNINQTLEVIWPKVYPYGDYLSARLRSENDYVLEVQTKDSSWIRVEGLLSGGERTCAALSIRVAIALSLTKRLGLLILDEPTHNLDTKTISMLSSILDKELPELVEQIFIITHDQKLLETTNASKYIIERDKENDGVSFIKEE